jgi:hypothetical protein
MNTKEPTTCSLPIRIAHYKYEEVTKDNLACGSIVKRVERADDGDMIYGPLYEVVQIKEDGRIVCVIDSVYGRVADDVLDRITVGYDDIRVLASRYK